MLNNWSPSISPPAITSLLILLLVFLQQGCATAPMEIGRSPVTEETRSKFRSVGIAVSEELPRITLDLPSKGAVSGAGRKAGKWAGNWAMASVQVAGVGERVGGRDGLSLGATTGAAMLAVVPVVVGAGALYGAIEAPSAGTVESQETQVRGVLHADTLIQHLEQQVFGYTRDRTDFVPALLPNNRVETAGRAPSIGTKPDAKLTLTLKSVHLRGAFDVDPPLALYLETHVTLLRSQDAAVLYSRTFHYETGTRQLTEWTANDATLFRESVNSSLSRLTELIVDDVLLTISFDHDYPWRKPLRNTMR